MRTGWKIITVFFLAFYLCPLVSNELFADRFNQYYVIYPLTFYAFGSILGTYLLGWVVYSVWPSKRKFSALTSTQRFFRRAAIWYARVRLPFAFLALAVSIVGYTSGLNAYRYTEESISQSGSRALLMLLMVINTLITVDFTYHIFGNPITPRFMSKVYFENVLLAGALAVSTNGTMSMLRALLAIAFAFFPAITRRIIVVRARTGHQALLKAPVLAGIGVALFLSAWIAGETIKGTAGENQDRGFAFSSVLDRLSQTDVLSYLFYVIETRSTYYYSLLYTTQASRRQLNGEEVSPIVFPLRTAWYRLDLLLGGILKTQRPEIGAITSWNYISIVEGSPSEREGTSPGLIASFDYLFPFPLNIFFAAGFTAWLARRADGLMELERDQKLGIFGALALMLYLMPVFESPFDYLLIFDDGLILFVGLVILSGHNRLELARVCQISLEDHADDGDIQPELRGPVPEPVLVPDIAGGLDSLGLKD